MDKISLTDLNLTKAEALVRLYNNSRPLGLGFLAYTPGNMTVEHAEELLSQGTYFDYLYGRVMKVDLSEDSFNPWLYDRDNGPGAALDALTHD